MPARAKPIIRSGYAYWSRHCECGARTTVRGKNLTAAETLSCGCWRASSDVRHAAALRTPAKRRREIARIGGDGAEEKGMAETTEVFLLVSAG